MSGSYRQCAECGKRALNFATRCPGCGVDLPDPARFEPDNANVQLNWSHSLKGVAVVLAIGGAIAGFERGTASPAELSAETTVTRADTAGTSEVMEALPAVAPPVAEPATAAATVAAPAIPSAGLQLIATTWTNVRGRRTRKASLEAMLEPGDTVTADSLVAGWYRIALYGEVLGWAREAGLRTLDPGP